jgi:hypothetical protein
VEADTYVDEAYTSEVHYTDTTVKAGYIAATDRNYEAYFRFPLGALPAGSQVAAATLLLYASSAGSASLQLKTLTGPFSDTTCWNNRPGKGSYLGAKSFTAGSYNEIGNDALKTLVQNWRTGTTTNDGLALVQEGAAEGTAVILSLENGANPPQLLLEYTLP